MQVDGSLKNVVSGSPVSETRYRPTTDAGNLSSFFRFHGFWSLGVRTFRQITFTSKAACISLAFLVPITLLSWNYYTTKQQTLSDIGRERAGVAFVRGLLPAIKHGRQLRRFTLDEATSGVAPSELAEVRAKLNEEIATIKHRDLEVGDEFETHTDVAELETALGQATPASAGFFKVFETHSTLNAALLDLLAKVNDGSGLTLDPELDTYYLMDAGVVEIPSLLEQTARLRILGTRVVRTAKDADVAWREIMRAMDLSEYAMGLLRTDLAKVTKVHPEMNQLLDANATLTNIVRLVQFGAAIKPESSNVPDIAKADALDSLGGNVVKDLESLQTGTVDSLDALLAARERSIQRQLLTTGLLVGVCLLIAIYLFYSFFLVMNGGLKEVRRHLDLMAGGDLTSSPTPWGRDDAAHLMLSLRGTQQSVRQIVARVRIAADSILVASTEIATGANDLSMRTEQSAATLEQSASSMEEISSTVKDTASNANDAAQQSTENTQIATRGGEIIGTVMSTMDAIHASSNKIGEIIGTIDGIAFQTNILALNAAVEAARAGEAGRGFAVVATEVRALSQRTAAAAREVKALITSSVEQVASGSTVVKLAGSTIGEIVTSSRAVNTLLSEIALSVEDQALRVTQTTEAVQGLDSVTQQNAALVEQTAAAATSLQEQARALTEEVAKFRLPA